MPYFPCTIALHKQKSALEERKALALASAAAPSASAAAPGLVPEPVPLHGSLYLLRTKRYDDIISFPSLNLCIVLYVLVYLIFEPYTL